VGLNYSGYLYFGCTWKLISTILALVLVLVALGLATSLPFWLRPSNNNLCFASVGSCSCKQLSASFRSDVNFFATEVYGATFLLVALSWTGFWVDPRRHGGCGVAIRLGLGLFIVLILVVYGIGFRLLHNKVSALWFVYRYSWSNLVVCSISDLLYYNGIIKFDGHDVFTQKKFCHLVSAQCTRSVCWAHMQQCRQFLICSCVLPGLLCATTVKSWTSGEQNNITRNTLDCDQSNVYSSRVVSSAISQDLLFRSFSLYRRSASDPPLWNKFRISTDGKVWSAYIHTCESDNALLGYGRLKLSKNKMTLKRKLYRLC